MTFATLIVDDQADIRTLLRVFIEQHAELSVVGEASSGDEALRRVVDLNPDVIVLDHMMPGMTGIEAARAIRALRPNQRIVLCSAYLDDAVIEEARQAGISRCIGKMDLEHIPELILAAV